MQRVFENISVILLSKLCNFLDSTLNYVGILYFFAFNNDFNKTKSLK